MTIIEDGWRRVKTLKIRRYPFIAGGGRREIGTWGPGFVALGILLAF